MHVVITQKGQEIGIKFTITDCSNFDKRCSGAHFCVFLILLLMYVQFRIVLCLQKVGIILQNKVHFIIIK